MGSPEFEQTLTKLAESVNHHVEEEESTLLPMLAKKVGRSPPILTRYAVF